MRSCQWRSARSSWCQDVPQLACLSSAAFRNSGPAQGRRLASRADIVSGAISRGHAAAFHEPCSTSPVMARRSVSLIVTLLRQLAADSARVSVKKAAPRRPKDGWSLTVRCHALALWSRHRRCESAGQTHTTRHVNGRSICASRCCVSLPSGAASKPGLA